MKRKLLMRRKLAILGIVLIFVAGIGVMSYPLVSSVINNLASRSNVAEYKNITQQMSSKETLDMIEKAQRYNNSLTNNVIITDPFDSEAYEKIGDSYENALNVDGNGLIGYIDVPKINVYLPIYHGTSESILSRGAGHLMNTSLPIGGESSHSVISAHTAFPGETFFDYLTDMKEGDEFFVHILDRVLKYEVDSIKVVLPEETDDLRIINGEDYVTLLTCTPYSINTHRLLVRGKRVAYDPSAQLEPPISVASFGDDGIFFLGFKIPYWTAAVVIAAFVAITVAVVLICLRRSRRKNRSEKGRASLKTERGGD